MILSLSATNIAHALLSAIIAYKKGINMVNRYQSAKEIYADYGVDTEEALARLQNIPVSIHCWQLDDLSGFEAPERGLSGGIAATGNAAGKPRSKEEYMEHLDLALSLIPGKNKLALHAIYLNNKGDFVDRDEIEPEHFVFWVDYAKNHSIGLDFNPTYFSHEKADDNFTLASRDDYIRRFWIEHGKRCRRIGAFFGKELGETCVTNHWIPDGYKDYTIDKLSPRLRLKESLDEIFSERIDSAYNIDSVEGKLFGLGIESYTVGSHEFYQNYAAIRNNCIPCLDMGHFHPTEVVSGKLSSFLAFGKGVMLHVSRPVRWDSDHVVTLDDEVKEVMLEIKRADAFDLVHIGSDYFDASINRIAATVIGARSIKKALLYALLEPTELLRKAETDGKLARRLELTEQAKALPFGIVWEEFCERNEMPGAGWIDMIER